MGHKLEKGDEARGKHRGRVLVVDDNADLVGTLRDVLAPHGFDVRTAARGEQALEMARAEGLDVAIVDVKLPDASGVDLIRPLREAAPHAEVVLITGFASIDAAIAALRSGAFAFVLKSFRPEELISTVEQASTKVRLVRARELFERRYRELVELTDALVVGLDAEGHVALMNPKAAAMAQIEIDEARGLDFVGQLIPAEDRARLREMLAQARGDDRSREVETGFFDGGAGRRIRWHLTGRRGGGDAPGAAIVYGIGIDVTERRLLERRAADAEALSAMGTLAMNLAHEIRNPLNAAVLQLHLLGRDVHKLSADAEAKEAMHRRVEVVGSEIGRLNRLLTEFLDLARPRGIGREPVHVGKLVDEVLELERGTAESHGVTIEREEAPDGCVAIGDREKLKQVFLNLVVNAVEAMKDGGTLSTRVRPDGDAVVVEVADTGPGIAPDVLGNVFDPFFTTKAAGTGLGLSIVRKIVDQHCGRVEIAPREGSRGTLVRVRIPSGR